MIVPNSSDGTNMALDHLRRAWHALHDAKLTIQEINDGDYTRNYGPQEFNVHTCKELCTWIDNCAGMWADLMEVVGCTECQ
jgi:hypothetical protein